MKPIKENVLKVFGREPETLDELAHCVIAVINSQPNRDSWSTRRKKAVDNHCVVGFAWNITYRDLVSNSHSNPEGLPSNFGGKPELPKGYPGFNGRVWIRYAEEPKCFGSDAFQKTLTHTGTGGAGSYDGPWAGISSARWRRYGHKRDKDMYPEIHCFSWDYRIYLADWPMIAKWVEKQQMWSELSGKPWQQNHKFSWTDEEILAADAEFIKNCAIIKAKEAV